MREVESSVVANRVRRAPVTETAPLVWTRRFAGYYEALLPGWDIHIARVGVPGWWFWCVIDEAASDRRAAMGYGVAVGLAGAKVEVDAFYAAKALITTQRPIEVPGGRAGGDAGP